jgi:hypothetical protein
MLSDNDLYYLRSCLTHLRQFYREVMEVEQMVTLGNEALSDNIDWLDCFIDQHERDSGRLPQGEAGTAECEASQSGGTK